MTEPKRTSPSQAQAVIPAIAIAAFPETQGVVDTLREAAGDRRMERARIEIFDGGIEAAIERFRTVSTPNLIVFESSADQAQLLPQLARLAEECLPTTRVLVIGHRNDVSIYRELISHGVSDYVVAPIGVVEFCSVVGRIYADMAGAKLGSTIAFIGASGGAGSSTVAHNTAWAMATDFEADVLLIDTDVAFGTAGLDFNLEATHQGIADVMQNAERLDEALLDRLLAKPHPRLSILSAPAVLDADELKEGDIDRLVELAQSRAGFTVFDLAHLWTPWVRKLLKLADQTVVTATPDLASLRNSKALLAYLKAARPNDPPAKLVLNQTGVPRRPQIKPVDFAEAAASRLDACLAFDPQLFGTAGNNGQMVGQLARNSKAARSVRQLATNLVDPRPAAVQIQKASMAARLFGRNR